MPTEYDYRVIYLKSNRPHCYANVTCGKARAHRADGGRTGTAPLTR